MVGELGHPALVDYLHERGIDTAMAQKYCHEVRYRIGEREYFAIGFRNDAGGWELRNRSFKGSSTPKNITTIRGSSTPKNISSVRGGGSGAAIIGTGADTTSGIGSDTISDTVMVFEGFIDFLSYLSLKDNPSPTIDTAVLNSISNLRRAIPFLESHRTVHAFLDNDEAGRNALDSLRESLSGSEMVDQSVFYRNHKDLNDYWQERVALKNRVEETNAADQIKRPTSIEGTISSEQVKLEVPKITNTAVQFRRSIPATPVKKRGRGV